MKIKEKSVLDKIFSVYNELYEAEKKIADYVINNKEKIADMTVSELSDMSNASEATIIRFSKKCGFNGFHQLKMELAKESVATDDKNISNDLDTDNIAQSLQNILANKIEELKQTMAMMDEENIRQILKAINDSRIVQFAAVGNTIPLALDGAYKFNQIGFTSVANVIWETQISFASNLGEKDVLIVISSSGSSKRLINLVEKAEEKKVTTICITNHENSPLANICRYKIITATRERLFFDEFSFSRVSGMVAIETLFLLLISGNRDAYNFISKHEDTISDDKI